jgi:putative chitobiose transport system permease protein
MRRRYSLLVLLAAIAVIPFLWILSTALKGPDENIFSAHWWPQQPTLNNIILLWQKLPMGLYFLNSLVMGLLAIVFTLSTSVLAAYPLSRMQFKGKSAIFLLILLTMMLPFQVLMTPLFLMVSGFGLIDANGYWPAMLGLVVPFSVSGFGIFMVREAMGHVPKALEEAAILEGCSSWAILRYVVLPSIQPTLATLALFTLMATWGELLWPAIVLSKPSYYTMPVGLVYLQGVFSSNWRLIASGIVLSTLPLVLLYSAMQRFFTGNTLSGAIKG